MALKKLIVQNEWWFVKGFTKTEGCLYVYGYDDVDCRNSIYI